MKKLGLALGAGGARGVAHIGFLQALEDNGIKPDYVAGSSMGSVVGSCYCLGLSPDYMFRTVRALRARDILDLSPVAIKNGTLLKSAKMQALLNRYLGGVDFEDLKIPFACTGVDLISGEKVIFSHGCVATAVQASSSIPLVFAPVEYENMLIADGGVIDRVPVEEVRKMGAEVIVGVDVLGPLREMDELKSILNYFLRLIDIFDNKINKYNLKENACDIFCAPEMGDMSQYKVDPASMQLAYDAGYKSAMEIMDELKKKLN